MGSGGLDPLVRLSPNARIVEVDSRGGPTTLTLKLHEKDCWRASVIVQATVVVPTGNAVPDAGEQLIDSGCAALATCGSVNVTGTAWPLADSVTTGAGHTAVARRGSFTSLGSVDERLMQLALSIARSETPTLAAEVRRRGKRTWLVLELISATRSSVHFTYRGRNVTE